MPLTLIMPVKTKVVLLKAFIHLAALLPLINLYYAAFTDNLGADPVEAVIHFTGIGAFNLLLITLFVSPIAKRFKKGFLLQVRRLLGLYAFTYALMHLINFLAFEVQFDWALFINEIFERPYITVGMVAFIIIFSLAITSLKILQRKMGRSWQTLHSFNYLLVLLVGIHFYWSVKSDVSEPIIYLIIAISLLVIRKNKIKQWAKQLFK